MTPPGMTPPGMGQPAMGQPGMAGQPGMNQPGMPQQGGGWTGAYVGNGGGLVMVLQPAQQGTYSGYFEVQGQRYPLQARGDANALEGIYVVNGGQYQFYAQWYQGYVYLVEAIDGSEYFLEPVGASYGPEYPLPGMPPATQPPGAPAGNPWGTQ